MQRPQTFKARWVLPVSRPPIADGFVTIDRDEILEVSSSPPEGQCVSDLGDQILLPRLVNAHTHLEFSTLQSPFPTNAGFPGWVREVIKWRQQRDSVRLDRANSPQVSAIAAGLEESRKCGVGLLGEIATAPWPTASYRPQLPSILFLEQLGVLPEQAGERLAAVRERLLELRAAQAETGGSVGLSPHAPYSLSQSLFQGLIELGCREQVPLAMHLAETREEMDWLNGDTNGFCSIQERLGVPSQKQWRPAHAWLLEQLAQAPRVLVIHGNYLAREHWQQLARYRDRMSVVYCPRTHRYFGHSRYPLAQMLSEGVRVALGTDSRASNPDLDVLAELRFVRKLFPELDPAAVLQLATMNGAEALGQADRFGQLSRGMVPQMLAVDCPSALEHDPVAWLLDNEAQVKPLEPLP